MQQFIEIPATNHSFLQRHLIYDVGINDADYITQPMVNGKQAKCPYYRRWHSMLGRCYDKKRHTPFPTYIGCSVSDEWLYFSNFKKWMITQDWHEKHLDKDIINPRNKIYSPENCVFVTSQINTLLLDGKARRGDYPQGVCYKKASKNFSAICGVNGVRKHLGYFKTPEEASQAYKKFKSNHITLIANQQSDIRIKNGLLNHAELLRVG